jgi:hypothetical protein
MTRITAARMMTMSLRRMKSCMRKYTENVVKIPVGESRLPSRLMLPQFNFRIFDRRTVFIKFLSYEGYGK